MTTNKIIPIITQYSTAVGPCFSENSRRSHRMGASSLHYPLRNPILGRGAPGRARTSRKPRLRRIILSNRDCNADSAAILAVLQTSSARGRRRCVRGAVDASRNAMRSGSHGWGSKSTATPGGIRRLQRGLPVEDRLAAGPSSARPAKSTVPRTRPAIDTARLVEQLLARRPAAARPQSASRARPASLGPSTGWPASACAGDVRPANKQQRLSAGRRQHASGRLHGDLARRRLLGRRLARPFVLPGSIALQQRAGAPQRHPRRC